MNELFGTLTQAVHGSVPVALGAAFVWGVLSIVLSPCHLASIPLIVAFIGGQGLSSPRRAFVTALVFALGILVTIAAIGGVTAALGRMLGDVGRYVNYGLALIFLCLGLHFLGVVPLPWSGGGPTGPKRQGLLGAFVLGLVFGVGVGPCTFAYMAPMLGVTLKVASTSWLYGATLLLAYGVGHCAVIVLAGTSAQLVQRYLNWNEGSRGASLLRQACGVLVILGGAYLVYTAP
ncbi:MAG: cytochrome C biogenesis protein [Candidatus Eisenbacteria bacterium]|uniref:Cytochrome C biogenesis protein n=1 Tax=Eiseniibacteriota bacterium TaxID=2212470 RepID=A0A956SFP7_UNCEI|nr:cytochrome C biogenesis protein [Candidatus Eisenbacteria bacterium]